MTNFSKMFQFCSITICQITSRHFLVLPWQELRVELDKLLRQKIAKPDTKLSVGTGTGNRESALLRAIIDLITSEENTNWVSVCWVPFRISWHFFELHLFFFEKMMLFSEIKLR